MRRVLVNGREDGSIDPFDRGLAYGDGLFETIAVVDGRPRFLEWHFERLAGGARALGFPAPDFDLLRTEFTAVAGEPRCVVKLILTRGAGARGYRPPRKPEPTRIVAGFAWPAAKDPAGAGARVGWCATRLGRNPALAGLKHLNRLEQVLARSEWDDEAMDEGLMLDELGQVIGGTQSNLFARLGSDWVTPRLDGCGVAGVMRRAYRHWLAAEGVPVAERVLPVGEVESASALVLTNALVGAWPVRTLAGRTLVADPAAAAFNAWLARQ
jgi:4-amino-4-deoxychorismate lyase